MAADDEGITFRNSADSTTSVNAGLLNNDEDPDTADTLSISTVGSASNNRAAANVGIAIDGSNGGSFTIAGQWRLDF